MKKRLLASLLPLVIIAALLSTTAGASGVPEAGTVFSVTTNDQTLYYSVQADWDESGTNEVWVVTPQETDAVEENTYTFTSVTIPSEVIYEGVTYQVTGIRQRAFQNCTTLTSVVIPASVEVIGDNVFDGCSNLETMTISDGSVLTDIGQSAFAKCVKLSALSLPEKLETIGTMAFNGCSALTSINIPDTVQEIGGSAFKGCSALTSLTIPQSVTSIGATAFAECEKLTMLTIQSTEIDGLGAALKKFPNLSSVQFVEGSSYRIDSGLFYNGTVLEAMLDDSIAEVNILPGTTEIKGAVFNPNYGSGDPDPSVSRNSNLTSVTLPDTVTKIGDNAFNKCVNLTTINFPDGLEEIGASAFSETKLESVDLPDSVETIGKGVFSGCSGLKTVILGEGLKAIPDNAFAGVSTLQLVVIPASVTNIGENAFNGVKGDASGTTFVMQGENAPEFNQYTFGSEGRGPRKQPVTPTILTVIVPAGAENAYADSSYILSTYITNENEGEEGENIKPGISYSISLDPQTASVYVGDTTKLTVTSTVPANGTLSVTSSDRNIATAELEGSTVTISGTGNGTTEITVSIQVSGFTLASESCTVSVSTYTPPNSSTPTRYTITVPSDVTGGEVSVSVSRASRGTTVTLTATPDEGYALDSLTVTQSGGGSVSLTDKGDGRYTFTMPRANVTVEAAFVEIKEEPGDTEELPFTDVAEGAWYYDAVAYVYENNMMEGTSATTFAPGMTLSRAMVAQILYNLEEQAGATADAGFPDVAAGAWYADAVNWAAESGVVTGYDTGAFGPEDAVTREQLAVMLYRYAGSPEPAGSLEGFTDADSASGYAADALRWAVGEGLLTGKDGGRLDPAGTATRAEAAQLLARFAQR